MIVSRFTGSRENYDALLPAIYEGFQRLIYFIACAKSDGIFGDRMLALKARQGYFWSPSSPDMNPCDFFLWGVLKDKVYQPMPVSMNDLKQKIEEVFNDIPKETVKKKLL